MKILWQESEFYVYVESHGRVSEERAMRRREGRYLLRSNTQATALETVWENYLLLARIEQAFKDLKGSLSIRPI
ncbi:MAG: hypothetical protein B6D35_03055 [Candidatus Brocadia sp. UTAMX2]|jgi:hypothetical protein|nr:MAG: hypothetical protein B6D35_03055 [Candidatus Brocadia sp. UTAMX2]